MKKILLILSGALLMTIASMAQAPTLLTTTTYSNTLDTVVNTATKSTTPWKLKVWKPGGGVIAQVIVTKISGTVGGTLSFQGSMNGTDWSLIGSAQTPTDATANYRFATVERWYYYRVTWTGTGTMSASVKAYIYSY